MNKAWITILVTCLIGCDRYYGVVRKVNLDYVVDYRCIDSALRQVANVREVKHKYTKGDTPLTLSGLKKANSIHYFNYKTGSVNGYIYLSTNYENKSEISQTYGALNIPPLQKDVDTIRPVMKKIESSISTACGISKVEILANEPCSGIRCEN